MMVDLGVRIQQLRMERNMSQSELGEGAEPKQICHQRLRK